jgi:uncharacterized protein YrzB (UPF0473 family)
MVMVNEEIKQNREKLRIKVIERQRRKALLPKESSSRSRITLTLDDMKTLLTLISTGKANDAAELLSQKIRSAENNNINNNNESKTAKELPKNKIIKIYLFGEKSGFAIVDDDGKKRLHSIVIKVDKETGEEKILSTYEYRLSSTRIKIDELRYLGRDVYITPSKTNASPELINQFYNEEIDIL